MASSNHATIIHVPARQAAGTMPLRAGIGSALRRCRALLGRALARHRERLALVEFDDRMLRDIGLRRDPAERLTRLAGATSPRRARATWFRAWLDEARRRDAWTNLDEHMLRDIGLTPSEIARERTERFWRP